MNRYANAGPAPEGRTWDSAGRVIEREPVNDDDQPNENQAGNPPATETGD